MSQREGEARNAADTQDWLVRRHHWKGISEMPTTVDSIPNGSRGVHESVLRAFQILREVQRMLERGDSAQTVLAFIAFAEGGYVDG